MDIIIKMEQKKELKEQNKKILFQIDYNPNEDSFTYITNSMNNMEFRALICFMETCLTFFKKEVDLSDENIDFFEDL
jgi:ethanolamine utilization protein EutA (predicted chaperonin)